MRKTSIILVATLFLLMTSCFDLYTKHIEIDGPYFVQSDPGASYQNLYYDLGDGNAIGRIENVKKVGHTKDYIIAEVNNGYYFIDRKKDNKYLDGDEITGNIRSKKYFLDWLKSQQNDFKFDFEL